jgi:uncharacterized membrane protein YesL
MELNGLAGRLYRVCEWIMNLAYINLLWILFTLCGFVAAGMWPATVAMFAVMRKWLQGEDVPVFRTYWGYYKQEFVKGNALGYILSAVGILLWFDLRWFLTFDSPLSEVFTVVTLVMGLLYAFTSLYLYPVYVHFEMPFFHYFRATLLIGMSHPFSTILMVVSYGAVLYLLLMFPGLLPFFGTSRCAMVISWYAASVLAKVGAMREQADGQGQAKDQA